MSPIANSLLGLAFLALAVGSTFLMYHLWGYPFDKEKLRSSAPRVGMLAHRVMGWAFVAVYLYFMSQMLPRLWSYQVEFPARTVAHLTLGMAIGGLLLVKIVIVRFFKHMEGELAPFLGTGLFVATVMLIGLSAPFAFKETYLQANALDLVDEAGLVRIAQRLESAGLKEPRQRERFASVEGLEAGRNVLFGECVECHDLRTVLARPRTPKVWRQTVTRMGDRAALISPISEDEQWAVTAYLIAISPDLQRSAAEHRHQRIAEDRSREAAEDMLAAAEADLDEEPGAAAEPGTASNAAEAGTSIERTESAGYDPERARAVFEQQCSLCHPLDLVNAAPPGSAEEARELVSRMVENGMPAGTDELELIVRHLTESFVQ